jgi:hypothetical protein
VHNDIGIQKLIEGEFLEDIGGAGDSNKENTDASLVGEDDLP